MQIACEKLGLSRWTFYRWKKEDAQFAKQVEEAMLDGRLLVNDLAESQLIGAVKDRNFPAIMYWLKHHHPSYKTRVALEGSVEIIEQLPPEQKEALKKKFALLGIIIQDHEQPKD